MSDKKRNFPHETFYKQLSASFSLHAWISFFINTFSLMNFIGKKNKKWSKCSTFNTRENETSLRHLSMSKKRYLNFRFSFFSFFLCRSSSTTTLTHINGIIFMHAIRASSILSTKNHVTTSICFLMYISMYISMVGEISKSHVIIR